MKRGSIEKNDTCRRRFAPATGLSGSRQAAFLCLIVTAFVLCQTGTRAQADPTAVRSSPNDTTSYVRPLVPGEAELSQRSPAAAPVVSSQQVIVGPLTIVDVVVSNTNPNLTNTDTAGDGETTIAINPANTNEIVISAFSGGWGANAPLYRSTDGGVTWTRQVTVPPPTGWPLGCPCDWVWDWGRNNQLSGTILANSPTVATGFDVVTTTTTNPTSSAAFAYFDPPGAPVRAQETNWLVPNSLGNVDQPWLLVNPDPSTPAQDNVYVAWDNFSNSDGVGGVDMRVAVSYGVNPPNFTVDRQVGNSLGVVNPGLRLAADPVRGIVWALWGRNVAAGNGGSQNMNYMLNMSEDGGVTWTINGNPNLPASAGIAVASADSTQPWPKFGGVNALLGGVHHAAVDRNTGDLYYVYGNRDSATGNDRLAIRRIQRTAANTVSVGAQSFVTGQVEAALPSVAVLDNGTVGVFYYTFDGADPGGSGFPQFSAHLAYSVNQGGTFTDIPLLTFLSPATDSGAGNRQRVLGDYVQTKVVGNCFLGSFVGNGAAFGRAVSNNDPIFFRQCLPDGTDLSITKTDGLTSAVPGQDTVTYTIVAANAGPTADPSASLSDTFPAGLTCTYSSIAAGGATGNTAAGTGNLSEALSLPAGSSVTYTVACTIDPGATGTLSNTATIAASLTDPFPGNNSATDNDTVLTPMADIAITKTGPAGEFVGDPVSYTITVTNAGPSHAPGVTVSDTIPAGLDSVTWTCTASTASTCTPNGSGDINDVVTIQAGGMLIYTVNATAAQPGQVLNNVSVTMPAGVTDPIPGNSSDSLTTRFVPRPVPLFSFWGWILAIFVLAAVAFRKRGQVASCDKVFSPQAREMALVLQHGMPHGRHGKNDT